jgi:hypothetical protein
MVGALLASLRKEIEIGEQSGEAGPWDVEDIKAEGRRVLAARKRDAA